MKLKNDNRNGYAYREKKQQERVSTRNSMNALIK